MMSETEEDIFIDFVPFEAEELGDIFFVFAPLDPVGAPLLPFVLQENDGDDGSVPFAFDTFPLPFPMDLRDFSLLD